MDTVTTYKIEVAIDKTVASFSSMAETYAQTELPAIAETLMRELAAVGLEIVPISKRAA